MPPMDAELLRHYLEFYQDLGIKTLYRQTPTLMSTPVELPPLSPEGDTLLRILEDIGDCRRCPLHEGRNKLVFGVGNEK